MLRPFLKDSAIYTIPAILSRGLSLFLIPLYTRVLSTADYGSLDLLTVFAGIVNLTIAMEVSQGLARYYAAEPEAGQKVVYASTAFWFTIACYTIFVVLLLPFTSQISSLIMGQSATENAFRIGLWYVWINGLFYLIQNQFRWELRSREYAVVSMLMTITTAGISVMLTYGLHLGLQGLLLGMVAGSLAGTMLGLFWLRNSFRFQFDKGKLHEMLYFSTPLVVSGIAVWASLYIDRIMINHLLTVDDVGLYGVGYRVASVASLVMIGFQGALTPLIYTYHSSLETPHQLARIFRLFVGLATLIFLALSLFAADIVKLLTTEPFYKGAAVVVYLVPAVLLANMYIFAPGIGIAKKNHLMIWINVGGALLNIGLNYALIPVLGIVGAGMATLIGYLSVFVAYMVCSQKLYPVPHQWPRIIGAVFLATLLAWLVPQLEADDFLRWQSYCLAIGVYAFTSWALGLLCLDDLRSSGAYLSTKTTISNHG